MRCFRNWAPTLRGDSSRTEAQRRLQQYGPNQLKSAPETPWWRRLLEQFQNFLVIILLVATVISIIEWLLQDPRETDLPYEAIVILAIVILNALLGYFQESRAERSVRALMALAAPETTVMREGERQRIPAHDIVPGDIVLVEAGDKVPADARVIESANLRTDEAPLTGESVPVTKVAQPIDEEASLGDRRNMLFASTVATYGRGRAVVVATGMESEVGRIAGLLEAAEKEPTPLQQELDRTGKRLSVIMLGICGMVFLTGLLSDRSPISTPSSRCFCSPSPWPSRPSPRRCPPSSRWGSASVSGAWRRPMPSCASCPPSKRSAPRP